MMAVQPAGVLQGSSALRRGYAAPSVEGLSLTTPKMGDTRRSALSAWDPKPGVVPAC
jgi:hypothetical protein